MFGIIQQEWREQVFRFLNGLERWRTLCVTRFSARTCKCRNSKSLKRSNICMYVNIGLYDLVWKFLVKRYKSFITSSRRFFLASLVFSSFSFLFFSLFSSVFLYLIPWCFKRTCWVDKGQGVQTVILVVLQNSLDFVYVKRKEKKRKMKIFSKEYSSRWIEKRVCNF